VPTNSKLQAHGETANAIDTASGAVATANITELGPRVDDTEDHEHIPVNASNVSDIEESQK
jgi:hypothetical protein